MKNKLTITIILFLLLIPFRLPISILFVKFFEWIIGVTTDVNIPNGILATNVIISKLVYNITISSAFIYNIEMFSREKYKRKAADGYTTQPLYWWCVPIIILLVVFIIADAVSVNEVFFATK